MQQNTLEEEYEKMDPQETILKSTFKMDKKMAKFDEKLSANNASSVLNKNNISDLSDLSDILKYDTESITDASCAGASGTSGGFIDYNNSNHGPPSRKQLRFPDSYDDYEEFDSMNIHTTDGVHRTLSMTNRYNPDEISTDTLQQQQSSICNISIHSQAMGGSAGVDISSTASESGTKASKAFTNNTTSISSSTISSSDPNNRQQCSLTAAGTSERDDNNFLVKSISQIENFSTIINHNNNKRSDLLNHSVSQPDNLSKNFIKDATNVTSLHSTMEAILNVHRSQQYYTSNSDLEPFNNNQKSILTIHPQYRLLVSDTNSPAIIESTIHGNNGYPEQLITQQQNTNEIPISRHSSTETIQSKLSAMQLNEATVMGTLSSNVSQQIQQTNTEEKLNTEESISKYTERITDNDENDLIRSLIIGKFSCFTKSDSNSNNVQIRTINSNISNEEKIVESMKSFEEVEYDESLSAILGPFSMKIDKLIELYSKEDDMNETYADQKSKDTKLHVSFADQEFSTVEYCSYDGESTNDEFDIETATSNDQSAMECDRSNSISQYFMSEKNARGKLRSTALTSQSSKNLSPICGVIGSPVTNFKELSTLYTKQNTSPEVVCQNFSTVDDDEENNQSIMSKSFSPSPEIITKSREICDVTTSIDSRNSTPTPRSQNTISLVMTTRSPSTTNLIPTQKSSNTPNPITTSRSSSTISIENQISYAIPIPVNRINRWSRTHGLPQVLECLDTTEIILMDLDNGALKREHGIMHSYTNEKVYTFRSRTGELLFYGIEHPQFCSTTTCERYRPFEMNVYDINGREIITFSRFTSCVIGCLLPCFYHTLCTYCPGQIQLGKIKQDITLCIPSYTVYDNMDRDICVIRGPLGAYLFGSNLSFCIYNNSREGYVDCGLITDQWEDEQNIFKDNSFGIKFPLHFGPKRKILLLSAAVLLKYVYFSGSMFRRHVNDRGEIVEASTTIPISIHRNPETTTSNPIILEQPKLSNHLITVNQSSESRRFDISTSLSSLTKKNEPTTAVKSIRRNTAVPVTVKQQKLSNHSTASNKICDLKYSGTEIDKQYKTSLNTTYTRFVTSNSTTKINQHYKIIDSSHDSISSSSSSATKAEPKSTINFTQPSSTTKDETNSTEKFIRHSPSNEKSMSNSLLKDIEL